MKPKNKRKKYERKPNKKKVARCANITPNPIDNTIVANIIIIAESNQ